MRKKLSRAAAVVLAAVLMLALLTGCGAKSDIKKTISGFEDACHALDVRVMLEHVNPTLAKPILGALDLFGVEDTSNTLVELVELLGMFENAGDKTEEFVRSIEIETRDFAFNSDKDECTVAADLSYGDGNTRDITVKMVLKDEVWYISRIHF